MKLLFIEDLDSDVKNWQASLATKNDYVGDFKAKYLPKDIPPEKTEDEEYLRGYLRERFYKTGKVADFRDWLEANTNITEMQQDLEELMGGKFLREVITSYITVFGLGRYHVQGNMFYVIYRSAEHDRKERISSIYHELMHFMFHWHYWDQCRAAGLSDQDVHNFKESITVLLNLILAKRGLPLDKGYSVHEELRKQWMRLYEENPAFPIFFEKALALYKNQIHL